MERSGMYSSTSLGLSQKFLMKSLWHASEHTLHAHGSQVTESSDM
jgi:hypothetical protein